MAAEIWGLGAVFLLGVAAVAGGLALFNARRQLKLVAVGARAVGTAFVVAALGLAVVAQGEWSPFDSQQVVMGLVLAMLAIQMVLTWRLRSGSGGPVADVMAAALILAGTFLLRPDAPPLTCAQQAVAFRAQWALFLLGAGCVLAAGSAGLMLALRRGLARQGKSFGQPTPGDLYNLLTQGIFLALVFLGGGLALGVWWAWQTMGTLTGGDWRELWMAAIWLVAAMSQLAWQLEGQRGRWAAGLALTAASGVIFGLVFLPQMQSLLGT
jgi:hypothetical protein